VEACVRERSESLNADLVKAGKYTVSEQKQVTAWLDLRNKAAHGKYSEYVKQQVGLMLDGVRDFIFRIRP
jgi:polyhydroxyalkanoate synthesis regulator phasin